jgi:hypothetical protein
LWWDPWWWGPSWDWWAPPYYPYSYPQAPAPYGGDSGVNYDYDNYNQPSNNGQTYNGTALLGSPNTNPLTFNVAQSTPTVLVYLKDGTMYAASDYWLADGKLHYRVNYDGESAVDLDQVDLQRTVDENAKRGVHFSLKPSPDVAPAAPDSSSSEQKNTPAPADTPAPAPAHELETASEPAS